MSSRSGSGKLRVRWPSAIGASLILCAGFAGAQHAESFKGRLAPVPVNAATAASTLGAGSATGVLEGHTLVIKGTFTGLNSPATAAHVHRARPGMRGPSIFDLSVDKATSGTISGSLVLTPIQRDQLKLGWLYVQVHTERNPDGHLRGWLLK